MIRFRTLGALGLARSDGSELRAVLAQPRRLALLTYLAVARPHGSHRRDTLVGMFWPHANEERARAALSRAIYFLRRELGEGVIVSGGDEGLAIDADHFWCDAAVFETHLASGQPRAALALYHDDLLPGFFTSGANGFEEWLEREREHVRERAHQAAFKIVDEEAANGNLPLAVHWARRGVELAPFNELGLRRLLELLDGVGDRAGAEEAYQSFAARMSSDLDVIPSPETQNAIERIRTRKLARTDTPDATSPIDYPAAQTVEKTAAAERTLSRVRPRRWGMIAALAVVAVTTSAIGFARVTRRQLDTRRVLVTPFANLTGDVAFDVLGRVAAERIVQSLASTGLVDVVDPRALRVEHRVTADSTQQASAVAEATRLRAGMVVTGDIHREGSRLVVQGWITDVPQDRVVWAIPAVAASIDSVHDAIDEVRDRMTGALAALNSRGFAAWLPTASAPPRFAAFQEFSQGVELQLRGADRDAIPHLQRAIDLDSTFTWGRLQLAQGFLNVFEETRADSIAVVLNGKRDGLTPLQRHWLDWLLSLPREDQLGGYRAIHAAAELAPERFLLRVAKCALLINRAREAALVLERLSPDSPFNRETEYWELLTRSYHALGDRRRELLTAHAARTRYPDRIDVIAFALPALAAEGRVLEVRALLDTALAFPQPKVAVSSVIADMPGRGLWPGRLMVTAAEEFRAHGFPAAADENLHRAIDWYRNQSPTAETAERYRFELGRALYLARDWAGAEEIFRSLAAANANNFVYSGFLGTITARRGDSTTARRILAQFDTLRPTLARPNAFAGYWQSKISALLGDDVHAMQRLSEAMGPQGRSGIHTDFDFEAMWGSRAFREFVRPKG